MRADKVYLVGFMGAGKTTVARALARRLDWASRGHRRAHRRARAHQTVAALFAKQGEAYFRTVERAVLLEQIGSRHTIVATGGGTFVDPQNRAVINRDGVSVWLDVPLDRLIARVPADGRRPLAADRVEFERLYLTRRAAYEQAQVRIDAGRASVDAIVEQLLDWLHAYGMRMHCEIVLFLIFCILPFMRYLVLTDIHANLEALETCLTDASARAYDRVLVLGDLIGYGADPNAVVECVQHLKPAAIVRGNHDKIALGIGEAEGFNIVAKSAAQWTLDALTPRNRQWLIDLPQGPVVVDDLVEICHGSPFDEDAYIFDELDALRAMKASSRPLCLFGHTHYPITFELSDGSLDTVGPATDARRELELRPGAKYLLNPGSVGQPRDGDPRAAYAIVDTAAKRVELMRLTYPVDVAQAKVLEAGLPEVLARRLAAGR